jgi:hypothetical protein
MDAPFLAERLNNASASPFLGVIVFHTVTRSESDGSRTINFVTMGETFFTHRQIEQRAGRTYMRAKRRLIADVETKPE